MFPIRPADAHGKQANPPPDALFRNASFPGDIFADAGASAGYGRGPAWGLTLHSDVWTTQQRCRRGHVGPACQACSPGSYSDQEGWLPFTECTECPRGYYSPESGTDQCQKCGAGKVAADMGAAECQDCAAGKVQLEKGQQECVACEAGSKQPLPGQIHCDDCPANYYCPSGTAVPLPCPDGSVSEVAGGATNPEDCQCSEGFFGEGGHAPCRMCPFASFQRDFGMTSCIKCPPGTNTSSVGGVSADQCVPAGPAAPPLDLRAIRVQVRMAGSKDDINASLPAIATGLSSATSVSPESVTIVSVSEAFGRLPNSVLNAEGVGGGGRRGDAEGVAREEGGEEKRGSEMRQGSAGLRDRGGGDGGQVVVEYGLYCTVTVEITADEDEAAGVLSRLASLERVNDALSAAGAPQAFRVAIGSDNLLPEENPATPPPQLDFGSGEEPAADQRPAWGNVSGNTVGDDGSGSGASEWGGFVARAVIVVLFAVGAGAVAWMSNRSKGEGGRGRERGRKEGGSGQGEE